MGLCVGGGVVDLSNCVFGAEIWLFLGFVTWRRLLVGDLVGDGWFFGGECRSGKDDVRMKRIL